MSYLRYLVKSSNYLEIEFCDFPLYTSVVWTIYDWICFNTYNITILYILRQIQSYIVKILFLLINKYYHFRKLVISKIVSLEIYISLNKQKPKYGDENFYYTLSKFYIISIRRTKEKGSQGSSRCLMWPNSIEVEYSEKCPSFCLPRTFLIQFKVICTRFAIICKGDFFFRWFFTIRILFSRTMLPEKFYFKSIPLVC